MKNQKWVLISLLLSSTLVSAAVKSPKNLYSRPSAEKSKIIQTLKLPSQNRQQVFSKNKNVKLLYKIAVDKKQPLQVRWRAVTSIGAIKNRNALRALIKLSKNKDWFLRNSSAIAFKNYSKHQARPHLERLLTDRALVVRTSAVKTIGLLRLVDMRGLLWKQLNSRQNFRGKQSLWVRKHIVQVLSAWAQPDEEMKFARLLKSKDKRLHAPSIKALERITGYRTKKQASIKKARSAWLKRYNLN